MNVPFVSQFDGDRVPRAGNKACYRACRVMMRDAGVGISDSTTNRIQVATAEDTRGRVSTTTSRTRAARDYIDKELAAGRPVTAGLSYFDANYNRDRITDHFVVISGKGTNHRGQTFYTYNDPIAGDARTGTNRRLTTDPTNGNLIRHGDSGRAWDGHAHLSMVIRNQR